MTTFLDAPKSVFEIEIVNGYEVRVLYDPRYLVGRLGLIAVHTSGGRRLCTVTVPPLRDFSYPDFFMRELGVVYTEDARAAIEVAILARDSLAAVRLACWHAVPL